MGLGLVLMVSSLYDSYGLAGALVAANSGAWALGTATLSNLVDRFGQRRVMYPAAIISASSLAVVVMMAMSQFPAWTLFIPAIISGATGGAPGALVRARWNYVTTDRRQLHTAFSLESTLDELTFIIGPVVATALATTVHPAAGLIAPVILGLLGAWAFYSQKETEPPVTPRSRAAGAPRQKFILSFPGVGSVVAVNLLVGCVFGAIDVTVVAATTEWNLRNASGIVLALFSLASAISGFYYGSREWHSPLPRRFMIGVSALLAACSALLLADSVWVLAAIGLMVGLTVSPTLITGNTIIGRLVPETRLTEGLAWMGTGIGIGAAMGSSLAGQTIDIAGYHAGFGAVVGFATLAGVIAWIAGRTLMRMVGRSQLPVGTSDPSPAKAA